MADRSRLVAYAGLALAALGAVLALVPQTNAYSVHALALAVPLVAGAAWLAGVGAEGAARDEDADKSFRRELRVNLSSMVLLVVFLLLALTELLAIPAALGHLSVFSDFGLRFVTYYPVLIAALLGALGWATLLASGRSALPPLPPRERNVAYATAGATGVFVLASLAVALGAGAALGVRSERAVFVLAASLVTLFFFLKTWLRLPAYSAVSEWLEKEERIKHSGLLRRGAYVLLGVAAAAVLVTMVSAAGLAPAEAGLVAVGLGMLALLGATFNVGVSHVVARLEMGLDNALDIRKKRRVVLSAASIGLTVLMTAIGSLTLLAFLAQAAGVAIFRALLQVFVQYYLAIFAVVLVPLIAAIYARTRFQTEVSYSDKLRALAIGTATLSIVLTFFGVFIGARFAEGTGIQVENAVLVMGAGVLCLIQFVKARLLLPSVLGLLREAVKKSEGADPTTQERIKNQMIATYVLGLLFVVGFVAFAFTTSMGVIPSPGASVGTDFGYFAYLLAGVALLVVVVMRYFQSVNMDQRWAAKAKKQDIGKRRMTSAEVKRYLILGFSIGTASLLAIVGILIQAKLITEIGGVAMDRRYATDAFVFAILVGIGPYGWYQHRESQRIAAIDQKFPEFLRDLAESQRAGMTLTEAVVTAAKGQYGQLTPELRKMAAQIEWGVSFQDALERFSRRVDTPLIKRTVALVVQASNAGGNVVDVLTAAADDAREIQQIVKERKNSMSIYVMIIYIAFGVFIGVIAVLNAQFIPEVAKAVEKADGVSIGGLSFKAFDKDDFKILFFHAAVIQGFGGGLVAGSMSGGKPVHGLRHSFLLVSIGWVLFRLVIR